MDAPKAGYAFEYLIETLNDSSHKKFFDVSKLGGTKYVEYQQWWILLL
ncbi:IREB2 isoform 2 [Pongo abelii]|uniref:IREB2 isoform 2 n=1 Tax=Pongo abelii TaxID=9601 RepID=A0A2J8SKF2_PONAB|nr:IREB2 isoform 2 [Pongo abelii]